MCRFVLYHGPPIALGSLLTDPSHSLIRQSYHSRERREPLNGDGFGVAWYTPEPDEEPAVFRSVTPAWNNMNLLELARVVRSGAILAHVRAASPGMAVGEANCHPFRHGRLAFMHNGDVRDFAHVRRRLLGMLSDEAFGLLRGTTDSEHLFALLVDALARENGGDPLAALADALRQTLRQILALQHEHNGDRPVYLNLALSDGRRAVACRYTSDSPERADSLYLNVGRRYTCADGVCRMLSPDDGQGAVVLASERLSDDPGWSEVPVGQMVLVDEQRGARLEPCGV